MNSELDVTQPQTFAEDGLGGGMIPWVDLIVKHRALVAFITAIFSVAGALFSMTAPNQYGSRSQVLVEKLDKSGDTIRQNQELLLPSMNADEDYLNTQALIMTSGRIMNRAVETLGLINDIECISTNSSPANRAKKSYWKLADSRIYVAEAIRTKTSRVISLEVRGSDAQICQRLAAKITEIYLNENARENMFASRKMYAWLMDDSEAVSTPEHIKANEDMISSLESIVADPELQRLETEKLKVITSLRELSLKYRPRHPKIRQIADSLDQISRDVAARKELLTNNLKETLHGESRISNVRLLDPAVLAAEPIGPHRLSNWLVVTFMGLLVGVGFVLFREQLNRTIRTEMDMSKHLNLSCLGSLPKTKDPRKTAEHRTAGGYSKLLKDDLELRDSVVSIRTHILFSLPFERSRRIMFAGATPDKEESTAAILTALSIASMNREILLVDADMRHPQIHVSLGLDRGKGLADFLAGEATLEEVIREVPGSNLKVIAGGAPNTNSSALLASIRFDDLMDALIKKYDRVIVNVPPILYVPDAMIVAKNVSCAVLVCSAGVTKKESINTAVGKFMAMNRPLMGYVINQSSRDKDLRGQSQKDYKDYKNNYLKLQPHPMSQAPKPEVASPEPTATKKN